MKRLQRDKQGHSLRVGAVALASSAVAVMLTGASMVGLASQAGAKPGSGGVQVTLCHGTNSNTNPYVQITVDRSAVFNDQGQPVPNGHGTHTGPVWDPTLKGQHIAWGDIIPPIPADVSTGYPGYPGMNWTPWGQQIFENGCVVPVYPAPLFNPLVGAATLSVILSAAAGVVYFRHRRLSDAS